MSCLLDSYSREALEEIVQQSTNFKQVLEKVGYKTSSGRNHDTLKKYIKLYEISTGHFTSPTTRIERNKENIFCKNSTAKQSTVRRWYIKENIPYKCVLCGQDGEWNGKNLVLQLDHINGDNKDHRLENLRWLCPNCHSQTSNFAGKGMSKPHMYCKNEKNYCVDCGAEIGRQSARCIKCSNKFRRLRDRPSPQELEKLIKENGFTGTGKIYDVVGNTIKKWCKGYDMPTNIRYYQPKVAKPKRATLPPKLSDDEVEYIKENYIPKDRKFGSRALGRKFGVSHDTILKAAKS